jgi:hypothetical protein
LVSGHEDHELRVLGISMEVENFIDGRDGKRNARRPGARA